MSERIQNLLERKRQPDVTPAAAGPFYTGWAMEAYPEMNASEMQTIVRRQKEQGCNVVWIGHNNPGVVDQHKVEPGLSYAVYRAYTDNAHPCHNQAQAMVQAQFRLLTACRAEGMPVVLPVGYQIQMGETWEQAHPGDLTTDYNGQPLNIGDHSASLFSPAYQTDIRTYYQWAYQQFVAPYQDIILMVNLSDEPQGADYSVHADGVFRQRHGYSMREVGADRERLQALGAFQARYIVEYAVWSANLWQAVAPGVRTTMSFCGFLARYAHFMPEIEPLFRDTPANFTVTFDAYPRDGSFTDPITDADITGLFILARTLGRYSARYNRPLWLWSTANSWGLGQASRDKADIADAAANALYLAQLVTQAGGYLEGIAFWNYNVKQQGLYNDTNPIVYNPDEMFHRVSGAGLWARAAMASSSKPVRVLIFLRYADHKFAQADGQIKAERAATATGHRQRPITPEDYHARGVLYLPDEARFKTLVSLPEGENIGRAINDAMKGIEEHNPDLKDVLPKTYNRLGNDTLATLLKLFNAIEMDVEGDVFGKIYEYFLGKFAMSEGQRGGEFFTPTSIVRLIVEIIELYHGLVLDPACGSGGMFVQSARFVQRHQRDPNAEISIYGQERVAETVRLCKMNLAVHGLAGDIRQGNTYYEDIHRSVGKFDFVMANPPFNVNRIDKDRIKDDPRFPFSLPRVDNGNYIWIQVFFIALNAWGRAGFVMANSASDARGSELEIRKQLIQTGVVDVMVAVASNFFYTVTLPCTLWFLDRGKAGTDRHNKVLFLDAHHIYTQVDRAHREFTPAQIEFLANVVRLYRGREPETTQGSADLLREHFTDGVYRDVPGLCKVAALDEIEAQGWSLNPGRYVGVAERQEEELDFAGRLQELHEELEVLNAEAHELEERIAENVIQLLSGL